MVHEHDDEEPTYDWEQARRNAAARADAEVAERLAAGEVIVPVRKPDWLVAREEGREYEFTDRSEPQSPRAAGIVTGAPFRVSIGAPKSHGPDPHAGASERRIAAGRAQAARLNAEQVERAAAVRRLIQERVS